EGNVWFASTSGLHRFFYEPFALTAAPVMGFPAIASDGQGGVWSGSQGAPLCHLRTGSEPPLLAGAWVVMAAYRAPDDTLWIGTYDDGLWHQTLATSRPPAGDTKRLALWKATRDDWAHIASPPDLARSNRNIQAMTLDRSGGLWVSLGRRGLYRVADGIWTPGGGRKELLTPDALCAFTDSLGRIWFGGTNHRVTV